jgi:hypothetical protein
MIAAGDPFQEFMGPADVTGAMHHARHDLLRRIIGPRFVTLRTPRVCGGCGSDAFAMVERHELADGQWRVLLRCGKCETWQELLVSSAAVQRLDSALRSGLGAIALDLQALDRDRMAAQVESFVEALARDLIDARDFASPSSSPATL